MSGNFFWNSDGGGPTGPPSQAPPPAWGGWGGMYQGPHGIQGAGGVPGGATPPTLNAAGQALLGQMQGGGPSFRAPGGLGPVWQQAGMPPPAGGAVNGAGAGWSVTGTHAPLSNPGGNPGGTNAPPPYPGGDPYGPPTQQPPGAQNWFGPPGSNSNPIYNHFYNYIMQRWPGWGGSRGPGY